MKQCTLYFICLILAISCTKEEEPAPMTEENPQLIFSVEFDHNLPRLNNLGQAVGIPVGHAAQHPNVNEVSLHYIELAPDSLTWLGDGNILYQGTETSAGGDFAVHFDQAPRAGNGEEFIRMDAHELAPGTYEWVRVSLTYQHLEIDYRLNAAPWIINEDYTGTIASFVGFNTYISSFVLNDSTVSVHENKLQGFWAFETGIEVAGQQFGQVHSGDAAGVTVVNPISQTSPVPAGSCVVTGKLAEPLIITGNETEDIEIVLAFSINNSIEWIDVLADGKYEPGAGETLVDMGLRGLHPYVAD